MDYYYIWNKERTQLVTTRMFRDRTKAVEWCIIHGVDPDTIEIVESGVE